MRRLPLALTAMLLPCAAPLAVHALQQPTLNTNLADQDALTLALLLADDAPVVDLKDQAQPQERPFRPGTARLYWENDGAFQDPFDGQDRHYSNGFTVVLDHQPEWADDLAAYLPFAQSFAKNHGKPKTGAGYILGQIVYTPEFLATSTPNPADQPYAGYLYTGFFVQRQGQYNGREDVAVLDHFEFNLGIVGPQSYGGDVQTWVHETFSGVDPRGWDSQLENEITAQFFVRRKWRIDTGTIESSLLGDLETQVIPQAGFALGTVHRYADTAVVFRIGQSLPDDFGPGRIDDFQSATGDAYSFDGWSWFVFARVGGRVVQHNLFLDGSTWDDPSPSVDRTPLVGEIQGGFAIGYRPNARHRFDFSWGITYTTDTFEKPPGQGLDSYGTMVFSWVMSF